MLPAVFTVRAWNVGYSASRINNKLELLRRRPNPHPRRIVTVGEEIVVEPHASIGEDRTLEIPATEIMWMGKIRGREIKRKNHGPAGMI